MTQQLLNFVDPAKISILQAGIKCTLEPFDDLETETLSDPDHSKFIIFITRKNHVYFPRNPECSREDISSNNEWSELNCVLKPTRIVISGTTFKASLQVFGQEVDHVTPVLKFVLPERILTKSTDFVFQNENESGVWQVSSDLLNLIKKLTIYGRFHICDGFTEDELKINENKFDCENIIPPSLVIINVPFLRLESPKCSKLVPHTRTKNTCLSCATYLRSHRYTRKPRKRSAKNLAVDFCLDGIVNSDSNETLDEGIISNLNVPKTSGSKVKSSKKIKSFKASNSSCSDVLEILKCEMLGEEH